MCRTREENAADLANEECEKGKEFRDYLGREYIVISPGRIDHTSRDVTLCLQDSLHSEVREYLTDSDGWNVLLNFWEGFREQLTIVYDDSPDYQTLHELYLTANDYEIWE